MCFYRLGLVVVFDVLLIWLFVLVGFGAALIVGMPLFLVDKVGWHFVLFGFLEG